MYFSINKLPSPNEATASREEAYTIFFQKICCIKLKLIGTNTRCCSYLHCCGQFVIVVHNAHAFAAAAHHRFDQHRIAHFVGFRAEFLHRLVAAMIPRNHLRWLVWVFFLGEKNCTGTPASIMICLEALFDPIASIADGGGPINSIFCGGIEQQAVCDKKIPFLRIDVQIRHFQTEIHIQDERLAHRNDDIHLTICCPTDN